MFWMCTTPSIKRRTRGGKSGSILQYHVLKSIGPRQTPSGFFFALATATVSAVPERTWMPSALKAASSLSKRRYR